GLGGADGARRRAASAGGRPTARVPATQRAGGRGVGGTVDAARERAGRLRRPDPGAQGGLQRRGRAGRVHRAGAGGGPGDAAPAGGSMVPSRDASNNVVLMGIVMYVFAYVPAGANPDPELLLRVLEGLIERGGLPECAGQPAVTEKLDRLERDPQGELTETI